MAASRVESPAFAAELSSTADNRRQREFMAESILMASDRYGDYRRAFARIE
jgi:hypothetical protein